MCGIVGYIGRQEAADILVDGLRRLEYRGYDSAGVAVLNGGDVQLRRSVGKLPALEDLLKQKPVHGTLGLPHAMGDPRPAVRSQRASACLLQRKNRRCA